MQSRSTQLKMPRKRSKAPWLRGPLEAVASQQHVRRFGRPLRMQDVGSSGVQFDDMPILGGDVGTSQGVPYQQHQVMIPPIIVPTDAQWAEFIKAITNTQAMQQPQQVELSRARNHRERQGVIGIEEGDTHLFQSLRPSPQAVELFGASNNRERQWVSGVKQGVGLQVGLFEDSNHKDSGDNQFQSFSPNPSGHCCTKCGMGHRTKYCSHQLSNCFVCGQLGHRAATCPKRFVYVDEPIGRRLPQRKFCYCCGVRGHIAKDCPWRVTTSTTKDQAQERRQACISSQIDTTGPYDVALGTPAQLEPPAWGPYG